MTEWQSWSEWIREGYYVSYSLNSIRYYEHVLLREMAHYVLEWYETIPSLEESGPKVPDDLVLTEGYDSDTAQNQMWQVIFGIRGQAYIYVELPTDRHRHGVPKRPKPSDEFRRVSHFQEWMSDFNEPSFITEHIMMKPGYDRINLSAWNPTNVDQLPLLNFLIAKLLTERVGTEQEGVLHTPVIPDNPDKTEKLRKKWTDTLEKLYKRQIPHRPLSLQGVWAPETEG